MKKGFTYHKLVAAFMLLLVVQISLGTGINRTEKSAKSAFTLKNLNKNKAFTLSGNLSGNYQFKSSQFLSVQKTNTNAIQVNTVVRYQNGNTTYVFPYKFKVKAPLFKTPSAPAVH